MSTGSTVTTSGAERVRDVMAAWNRGRLYKWEAYVLIHDLMRSDDSLTCQVVGVLSGIDPDVIAMRMREVDAMGDWLRVDRMIANAEAGLS